MENELYDLDSLDGRIAIIGRQDMLDLAVMSREWSLSFTLPALASAATDSLNDSEAAVTGSAAEVAGLGTAIKVEQGLAIKADPRSVYAEVRLISSIKELSDEIMQRAEAAPSCTLLLQFSCPVERPSLLCPQIEQLLHTIWQRELEVEQLLSVHYGTDTASQDEERWSPLLYRNTVTLSFRRGINEEQMEDVEALLEHVVLSLEELVQLCYSSSDN